MRTKLMQLVVHRRRIRRGGQAAIAAMAIGLLALRLGEPRANDAASSPSATTAGSSTMVRDPFTVAVERDDPAIVTRLRIDVASRAGRLDDDGLTTALQQSGRSAGLLRIDGRLLPVGLVVDDVQ